MLTLTLRTDNPQAEVALYDGTTLLQQVHWQAHRQLAETLHQTMADLLKVQSKNWEDLTGIVCYRGPGSFTGLRIGLSVANALAYSLQRPIIGETGDDWQLKGLQHLQAGDNQQLVMPEYGAERDISPSHENN